MLKRITEKVLNISPSEFPRTGYAWLMRFLLKMGLIIGWTAVVSIFVSKFSASAMPVLFLVQAALTVCGMLMFSFLVNRIEVRKLAVGSAFAAGILLILAGIFHEHDYVFFPLVLMASGIFLPQLTLFVSNYIEDFFSLSEGERIFPFIESGETVGGLIGGIILVNSFFGAESYKMIYLWVLFIFAFLAAMFIFQPRSPGFYNYLFEMKIIKRDSKANWDVLKRSIGEIKKMHFLQILLLVFFVQWMLTQLVEFQYVKVVDESIGGAQASHEAGLTHGLGMLQMIFSGSAILMQVLLASRIIKFVGTFGGFLFHALISFMSAILMMTGFGYFTTVLTKNNFELSGVVNRNAYEASYYAFRHSTQKSIREFFECLVAPIGTIAATLMLLLIRGFFIEGHSLIAINLLLVLFTAFVLYLSIHLQKSYTDMVKENLSRGDNKIAKMNAIEILSQKGHGHTIDILIDFLRNEQDPSIKSKVIYSLEKTGNLKAIPAILECLGDGDSKVVLAAIIALADFRGLRKRSSGTIFSRQKVVDDLKAIYKKTENFEVKAAALRAIARVDENSASFLLKVLNNSSPEMQAECIRFMGSFADPVVAEYLYHYLTAKDPFVRAQAIVLTAKSKGVDEKLEMMIEAMMDSKEKKVIMAACLILPSLRVSRVLSYAVNHLNDADEEIGLNASVGLLEAGIHRGALRLADLLLEGNELILAKAKPMLRNLNSGTMRVMSDVLQKEVVRKAGVYGSKMPSIEKLKTIDDELLLRLKKSFEALNLEEERELIHNIIEHRENLNNLRGEAEFKPVTELIS